MTDTKVDEKEKRLKELEQDLAKELEQQVTLSGPTDARLEGKVALNPELMPLKKEAPPAVPPTKAETPSVIISSETKPNEEVNAEVDEVDALLNSVDGDFAKNLAEIEKNLADVKIGDFKAAGPEVVEEGAPAADSTAEAHPVGYLPFFRTLGRTFQALAVFVPKILGTILKLLIEVKKKKVAPKQLVPEIKTRIQRPIGDLKKAFSDLKICLSQYPPMTKLKFALGILFLVTSVWFLQKVGENFLPDRMKDPFLRSFEEVASFVGEIEDEGESEDIQNPLRHPEYAVLLKKIITSLIPPNSKENHMVSLEVYVECSSQQTAVEVFDRQAEIRHTILRVLETFSFEELSTDDGKEKLKVHIRAQINKILNTGRIQRLFFRSLNLLKN